METFGGAATVVDSLDAGLAGAADASTAGDPSTDVTEAGADADPPPISVGMDSTVVRAELVASELAASVGAVVSDDVAE
ncbi:hypothetical protein [Nakamurella antarctica]|uniref:hypothetical protein n=1 Tax=Nakamurella antarctica TaxID=1902245 RepID=UPI0013DD95C5|nr:hypothetical protein [Nakamurella antarctica]